MCRRSKDPQITIQVIFGTHPGNLDARGETLPQQFAGLLPRKPPPCGAPAEAALERAGVTLYASTKVNWLPDPLDGRPQ